MFGPFRHYDELFPKKEVTKEQICQATLAVVLSDESKVQIASNDPLSPFSSEQGSRINHNLIRTLNLNIGDQTVSPRVIYLGGNKFKIAIGEETFDVSGQLERHEEANFTELTADISGISSKERVLIQQNQIRLFTRDGSVSFTHKPPKFMSQQVGAGGGLGNAIAPMPGVIEIVNVKDGDAVKAGDPLVVMIAMKMEYVIKAPKDGIVEKVCHKVGDFVSKNTPLVNFKDSE